MEVAVLTATFQAEIARFMANMRAADQQIERAQKQLEGATSASIALKNSLNELEISRSKMQAAKQNLKTLQTSLETTDASAASLASNVKDIEMSAGQTASTVRQVDSIGDAAREAAGEYKDLRTAMLETAAAGGLLRGPGGRFASGSRALVPFGTGQDAQNIFLASALARLAAREAKMTSAMEKSSLFAAGAPRGMTFIPGGGGEYRRIQVGGGIGGFRNLRSSDLLGGAFAMPAASMVNGPDAEVSRMAMLWAMMRSAPGRFPGMFKSMAAGAGWGGGRGIWGPNLFGFGRGRFGRRYFGGMAGFGTLAGLGGFGAERIAASSLGLLGSMGGGLLGGGLLGLGALGTTLVGAGTNLAGMGQAAGDIHTVSKDLGALNTAIQQYGRNSTQAAAAQSQLNQDLKGFSPAARNAVLAAAQTSQAFKAMFDKLTGPAEKIGAEIINQAMHVGMKFLPTIGKYAKQNMGILQRDLQPFFKWLQTGGNAHVVNRDINNLNKAIKEHGANSPQAAMANAALNSASSKVGGLGYFQDLEKVFQKNFPHAIHAGEQGFELLVKTVDLAAQHVGHFMKVMDSFFTRMNGADFGKWAHGVDSLIGLFHSWLGMFVSLGKVIFSVFKPAVGLGDAFAKELTKVFNQVNKYLNQKGTQNVLHDLFSAHLLELIRGFGGVIEQLLPIAEKFLSAFAQAAAGVSKALGYVLIVVGKFLGLINKIPHADKVLGWVLAFALFFKANSMVLRGLALLTARIPIIGKLLSSMLNAASAGILRLGAYIWSLISTQITALIASFRATGDAAAAAEAESVAMLDGVGGAAITASAEVDVLSSAEMEVGGAAIIAEAEAVPALEAIGAAALAAMGPVIALLAVIGAAAGAIYLINKSGGKAVNSLNNFRHGGYQFYEQGGKYYRRSLATNIHGGTMPPIQISKSEYDKQYQSSSNLLKPGSNGKFGAAGDLFPETAKNLKGGKELTVHGPLTQLQRIMAQAKNAAAKAAAAQKYYDKLYGTPGSLPKGVPGVGSGSGGGSFPGLNPHQSALAKAGTQFALATQGFPSASQMTAKQAERGVQAADKYLSSLRQQFSQLKSIHAVGRNRVRLLQEEETVAKQISSVTKDRASWEKRINDILKGRKEIQALQGSFKALNAQNHFLNPLAFITQNPTTTGGIHQWMKNLNGLMTSMPQLMTPYLQKAIDGINGVLKKGIVDTKVRSAVAHAIEQLGKTIQDSLQNVQNMIQNQLNFTVNMFQSSIQELASSADSIFQQQTAKMEQGMDSSSQQAFDQNRSAQQDAMDQQIAMYEQLMQLYPQNTQQYLNDMIQVWQQAGVDVSGTAIAVNGQIQNGLSGGISAVQAQLTQLVAYYQKIAMMPGGIQMLESLGFSESDAVALRAQGSGSGSSGGAHGGKGHHHPHHPHHPHHHPHHASLPTSSDQVIHLHTTNKFEVSGKLIASIVREELIKIGKRNRSVLSSRGAYDGNVNA